MIPDRWTRGNEPLDWSTSPASGERPLFDSELLFPTAVLDLFVEKSSREGEFTEALGPPAAPRAEVASDRVMLRWDPPEGLSSLRSEAGRNPLLDVQFRVYRWREEEDPQVLGSIEVTQTYFQDDQLPLWRERFYYCVATVLEGKIGDLPTLIESKPSPVISVETNEHFSLEVLDGSPDWALVAITASRGGSRESRSVTVRPGERIGLLEESDGQFDTGLTLVEIIEQHEEGEVRVQRPLFLPDGRREVDPASGQPRYRTETQPVASRTLELRCVDHTDNDRSFTSSAMR